MTTLKIDETDPLAGEMFILRAMNEINRLSPYERRMKCGFDGVKIYVQVSEPSDHDIYSEAIYKGSSPHMFALLIERAALRCNVPCKIEGEQVTDGLRNIKVTLN